MELSAPYLFEYAYRRSVGPVLGRFLAGLREGRIEGVRTRAGRVLVPPAEQDPETGEEVDGWTAVGTSGTVTSWSRDAAGRAWALVRLDGADTAMLHRLEGDRPASGMRVRVRWRAERSGSIHDIECFEPEPQR